MKKTAFLFVLLILVSCLHKKPEALEYSKNILDFTANPANSYDRSSLAFSDQGAWFAYGFPEKEQQIIGFSGPFLMTEQNGVWCSKALSQLEIQLDGTKPDLSNFNYSTFSFASHLEQIFENDVLKIEQTLVFPSSSSAHIRCRISNLSEKNLNLSYSLKGAHFMDGLSFLNENRNLMIHSEKSSAIGRLQYQGQLAQLSDSSYHYHSKEIILKPNELEEVFYSHQFSFPEQLNLNNETAKSFEEILEERVNEKRAQLNSIFSKMADDFQEDIYKELAAKCMLTLQNNWRSAAGELKHAGLFPSYHYQWFHGFWAWDSWKHAVALAYFNPELAKDQIRAMYDYMQPKGFVPDCIYRDTSIEKHNYRNTKPPLSAWAVWEVYRQDSDVSFLKEMYPKIKQQHEWWYQNRDHDGDGLCEYGSTDGTLVAAKWESGMDNAVRFDESKILQNSETAWSLDQESVDLNAYLFAEKKLLSAIATELSASEEVDQFNQSAKTLLQQMNQFYDEEKGWYYDTDISGINKISVMGCEGWIPLWALSAGVEHTEKIKNNMMYPEYFNTKVPLQTLSAAHTKFQPDGGYWRGPVWLDQSYFGIMGLKKYGYHEEALILTQKLIHNAEGVLGKGQSIRENYQPLTGAGLEAENFSWSAAHYLLLMMEEE